MNISGTRYTLKQMHTYCLKYRDLVRAGGTPTPEQDAKFTIFQRATYETRYALKEVDTSSKID